MGTGGASSGPGKNAFVCGEGLHRLGLGLFVYIRDTNIEKTENQNQQELRQQNSGWSGKMLR